jgi:mycofactocin precursor peptide peptidase
MGKLAGQKWPALADSRPPVVLPLGSCEQHGPHPRLDADHAVAEAVAQRATTAHHGLWRLGGYCAPSMPCSAWSPPWCATCRAQG